MNQALACARKFSLYVYVYVFTVILFIAILLLDCNEFFVFVYFRLKSKDERTKFCEVNCKRIEFSR